MATKERLAAMAASICGVCSGPMVLNLVKADPNNSALEFRTYMCAVCGHSQTYTVNSGNSWPFEFRGKLPTVGFLGASASGFAPWAAAFAARMRELGWIEYRWSKGRPERYAEIAAEFVRLNVDVILTVGSAVPIVRQATTSIPIVFAVAT